VIGRGFAYCFFIGKGNWIRRGRIRSFISEKWLRSLARKGVWGGCGKNSKKRGGNLS